MFDFGKTQSLLANIDSGTAVHHLALPDSESARPVHHFEIVRVVVAKDHLARDYRCLACDNFVND